jgi:hypothetical protein
MRLQVGGDRGEKSCSAVGNGTQAVTVAMICPKTKGKKATFFIKELPMPKFNRLGPPTARHILSVAGALEREFHELSDEQVTRLLHYADDYAYRRPSSVGDSRGRRWHAYLLRRANQAETRGVAT